MIKICKFWECCSKALMIVLLFAFILHNHYYKRIRCRMDKKLALSPRLPNLFNVEKIWEPGHETRPLEASLDGNHQSSIHNEILD